MPFRPICNAFAARPRAQGLSNKSAAQHAVIRDQLSLQSWLVIGALIQGLLSLVLPYRNIVLVAPAALYIASQLTIAVLQTYGVIRNPKMDGVLPGRTAVVFPDPKTGKYDTPAGREVCAIILATRSNHPIGLLAPGYKGVGERMTKMLQTMDADPTKYGYLGNSAWIGAMDRTTGSENMIIVYFDSLASCHAWAWGPMHTEALEWWNSEGGMRGNVGIMHEIFCAPKNGWEGIYFDYHPTGLGALTVEANVKSGEGKMDKKWVSPLVEGKGKLSYSRGRMGLPFSPKDWKPHEIGLTEEEKEGLYN